MNTTRARIALIAGLLQLVASAAPAQQPTQDEVGDIKEALEEQEETIRDLKTRIEELEAEARDDSPEQEPAEGSVETAEPGGAPSPMEEAEEERELRYGRKAPVKYRRAMHDRQGPAARPEDYTLDPTFRGFIPVPRTVLMIKFNAVPRLDMNASSGNPGSEFRFVPALFPVEGEPGFGGGWRFNANANGSQLRVDVKAPAMPGNLRFYYQNDFFGSDTKNMQYRLQHLYGQFFGVLGGFSFGVFEDPDAWPNTVDYEGPNAMVFARRALLHYKRALSEDWAITLGLEDPDISIDTTGDPVGTPGFDSDAVTRFVAPDAGFNIRWTPGDLGHMQFSTIFRALGIDGDTVPNQSTFGWGINLAGSLNLTPRDAMQFTFVYGQGVGSMGSDTSFVPSDGALDADGRLVALQYWSTMAALTHHWTPRWRSTATYGYVNLQNTARQLDTAYNFTHYASANLMFQLFKRLSIGLEGLYGQKQVKSGARANIFRVQLGVTFKIFD